MSANFRITAELSRQVAHYASFPQTGVSLRQMVLFGQSPSEGTLLRASQFLREELPIRLAHRVRELEDLPDGLSDMPSIVKVKNWYAQSFAELIEFPAPNLPSEVVKLFREAEPAVLPDTKPNPSLPSHMLNGGEGRGPNGRKRPSHDHRYYANPGGAGAQWPPEVHDYNERFTKALSKIKRRHDPVVATVAQGVLEFKRARGLEREIDQSIRHFLDRFYMSRIGIRVLIGQHIALNELDPHDDYVGIICTKTLVPKIARQAIDQATYIAEEHYGVFKPPEVQLICPDDLTFMYIPSHLSHMLFEVLKNSLRATIETHGVDADSYPPVKVIVAAGKEDITIKVSDEGGGIPRSAIPLVWTYMYTTAEPESVEQDFQGSDFKAPMAGFGYGLPIARLYAQYLGGGLQLISMDGYGTDVYLHLSRLSESSEPLQ